MKPVDTQVMYLGRWVSRDHFRTYVFSHTEKKIVNSYQEYCEALASDLWFAERQITDSDENVIQIKRGRPCRSQVKA